MKKNNKAIGQNILRLRLARGMTQADLAKKLFVGQSAVARWENGANLPCRKYWPGIARALGVTVDELLRTDPTT